MREVAFDVSFVVMLSLTASEVCFILDDFLLVIMVVLVTRKLLMLYTVYKRLFPIPRLRPS